MHNVNINIGNGPAAGSATVTPLAGPLGPFTAPNFLISGAANGFSDADFSKIIKLQFFENGNLRGQTVAPFINGQLINYWDHLTITGNPVPEPASLVIWSLLGTLGLALAWRRKR